MECTVEDWKEDSRRILPAILELACYRGYDNVIGSYLPHQLRTLPVAPSLVALATLESIVTSSQTEHYGNAVSLLEQLHANFPEATAEGEDWVEAEKDYIELLVDLKTKAAFSQLLSGDFMSDKTRKYAIIDKFFDPQLCKNHLSNEEPSRFGSSPREYNVTLHAYARGGMEQMILSHQKSVDFQRRNLFYPPRAMELQRNLVTSLRRYLDRIRAQIPTPRILQWWQRGTELEAEDVVPTAASPAHSDQADSELDLDPNLDQESPTISPDSSVSSPSWRSESPLSTSPPQASRTGTLCTGGDDGLAVGTPNADASIVKPVKTALTTTPIKQFSIAVEKLPVPRDLQLTRQQISIADEVQPAAVHVDEETLSETDRNLLEMAASPVSSLFQVSSHVSSPFQVSSHVSSPYQVSSPVSSPFLTAVRTPVGSPFQVMETDTTEDEHRLVIAGLSDEDPVMAPRSSPLPKPSDTQSPSKMLHSVDVLRSRPRRKVAFRTPPVVHAAEKKQLSDLSRKRGVRGAARLTDTSQDSDHSISKPDERYHTIDSSVPTTRLRACRSTTSSDVNAKSTEAEPQNIWAERSSVTSDELPDAETLQAIPTQPPTSIAQDTNLKRLRSGKFFAAVIQSSHSPSSSTSEYDVCNNKKSILMKRKLRAQNLNVFSSSGSEAAAKVRQKRKRRRLGGSSPPVAETHKSWLDTIEPSNDDSHPNGSTPHSASLNLRIVQTEGSVEFDEKEEEKVSDEYPDPLGVQTRMKLRRDPARSVPQDYKKRGKKIQPHTKGRRKKRAIGPRPWLSDTAGSTKETAMGGRKRFTLRSSGDDDRVSSTVRATLRKRKPGINYLIASDPDDSPSPSDPEQEGYCHDSRRRLRHRREPLSQPEEINLIHDEVEASQSQSQYDYNAIQRAALDTTESIVSESTVSCSPAKSPILRRLRAVPPH